jgi:predicted RecA/RadA family phage recombinase
MATNKVYEEGDQLNLPVPSGVLSGAPTVAGQIPVVAQTDRDSSGNASCDLHGVYLLSVKGVIAGPANSAVAVGDIIYYTAGHTPVLDKDATGIRWGYALGTLTSGSTGTIQVKVGY